jgi:hypothetical protein
MIATHVGVCTHAPLSRGITLYAVLMIITMSAPCPVSLDLRAVLGHNHTSNLRHISCVHHLLHTLILRRREAPLWGVYVRCRAGCPDFLCPSLPLISRTVRAYYLFSTRPHLPLASFRLTSLATTAASTRVSIGSRSTVMPHVRETRQPTDSCVIFSLLLGLLQFNNT